MQWLGQPRVLDSPSAPSLQPALLVQPWPSLVKALVCTFGHAGSILWYWRCLNTRDSNGFMLAVAAATKSTGFSFGAKPAAGAAGSTLAIPGQSPGVYLWARRFYPLVLAVFKHARLKRIYACSGCGNQEYWVLLRRQACSRRRWFNPGHPWSKPRCVPLGTQALSSDIGGV